MTKLQVLFLFLPLSVSMLFSLQDFGLLGWHSKWAGVMFKHCWKIATGKVPSSVYSHSFPVRAELPLQSAGFSAVPDSSPARDWQLMWGKSKSGDVKPSEGISFLRVPYINHTAGCDMAEGMFIKKISSESPVIASAIFFVWTLRGWSNNQNATMLTSPINACDTYKYILI